MPHSHSMPELNLGMQAAEEPLEGESATEAAFRLAAAALQAKREEDSLTVDQKLARCGWSQDAAVLCILRSPGCAHSRVRNATKHACTYRGHREA